MNSVGLHSIKDVLDEFFREEYIWIIWAAFYTGTKQLSLVEFNILANHTDNKRLSTLILNTDILVARVIKHLLRVKLSSEGCVLQKSSVSGSQCI